MSVTSVAIQFTIIDLLSKGVEAIRSRMQALAGANKEVQRSFDRMASAGKAAAMSFIATREMARGLTPAVTNAASLQEAMLRTKGLLAGSAGDAQELARQLKEVKGAAESIAANAPFSAEDVINIENALLKAGVALSDVTGNSGAAFSASILAALSGTAPAEIGEALANIGTQFKLKGSGYGELADWLLRVDDASATSVPALVYGLRMAGSNAAALRISAKDSVTALGALAALGERMGSSYNNFLIGVMGLSREQRMLLKQFKLKFFEGGQFIGMDRATKLLRDRFGGIKDDQKRLTVLLKVFGEEGGRAANEFINAAKGFKELETEAKGALSAAQKMEIWAEGFNASLKKMSSTFRSTMATLFEPMLKPLTALTDKANELFTFLGKSAERHEGIGQAVSGLSAGAVGAGVGISALAGGAALYYGRKALSGVGGVKGLLGGLAGLTGGIMVGKAAEAAGVTSVFVTNWPADFGAGGAAAATGAVLGQNAGKTLPWLKGLLPLAGKTLGIGAAGAAGYGVGSILNEYLLQGTQIQERIGGTIAELMGWLGLHESDFGKEIKNTIPMNIYISDQAVVENQGMNTKVDINLKRGKF